MKLLDLLFRSPAVEAAFSDSSTLQGMLDFEAALARAEARPGVIPPAAVASIDAGRVLQVRQALDLLTVDLEPGASTGLSR